MTDRLGSRPAHSEGFFETLQVMHRKLGECVLMADAMEDHATAALVDTALCRVEARLISGAADGA